jgi:hypothetical protein
MALEVRSSKFPSPRSQNLHKVDFCTPKQGDQIWRIFAQRAIVNFWQFLKNTRSRPKFYHLHGKS